jgi:phytoene/squalene synthetase
MPARMLGAVFQQVNFLRDIDTDVFGLNPIYLPGCDFTNFSEHDKLKIEEDIEKDLREAYQGIISLPVKARFGVYINIKITCPCS